MAKNLEVRCEVLTRRQRELREDLHVRVRVRATVRVRTTVRVRGGRDSREDLGVGAGHELGVRWCFDVGGQPGGQGSSQGDGWRGRDGEGLGVGVWASTRASGRTRTSIVYLRDAAHDQVLEHLAVARAAHRDVV